MQSRVYVCGGGVGNGCVSHKYLWKGKIVAPVVYIL